MIIYINMWIFLIPFVGMKFQGRILKSTFWLNLANNENWKFHCSNGKEILLKWNILNIFADTKMTKNW